MYFTNTRIKITRQLCNLILFMVLDGEDDEESQGNSRMVYRVGVLNIETMTDKARELVK